MTSFMGSNAHTFVSNLDHYNQTFGLGMGTCQPDSNCQHNCLQELYDTAPIQRHKAPSRELVLLPSKSGTPTVEKNTLTGEGIFQSSREPTKIDQKNNAQIAERQKQQTNEIDSPISSPLKDQPKRIRIRQPSQIHESIILRWHEPNYQPSQLFVPINYDELFKEK